MYFSFLHFLFSKMQLKGGKNKLTALISVCYLMKTLETIKMSTLMGQLS